MSTDWYCYYCLYLLPGISTNKQFIEEIKVQCDLGRKRLLQGSNSIETYISIKHGSIVIRSRIVLAISVSSDEIQRSFSKMRRIKTYIRSTMIRKRLNDLALLLIESKSKKK